MRTVAMERARTSGEDQPAAHVRLAPAVGAPALAYERATHPGALYHAAKRALDIVGALCGLALLALVFPVVALLILLDDGMPIIYRREALGLGGQRFQVYKFRSMCRDADTYLALHPEYLAEYQENVKLRHDPRVTRVGRVLRRTSLDELPQFVNVLRGDMSLVGPRSIHPEELARYGAFADQRQQMRPGLTGLWQVRVRCDAPYSARVMYDSMYYHTRSLRTDLAILLATIPAVLTRRGAY
jgi:exopolysaccharide production protein ExoY